MRDLGKVESTVKPDAVTILEDKVLVASDIQAMTRSTVCGQDDQGLEQYYTWDGYEYNLKSYGKDEYIALLDAQSRQTSEQVIDAQLALCDLYEAIMGDEEA